MDERDLGFIIIKPNAIWFACGIAFMILFCVCFNMTVTHLCKDDCYHLIVFSKPPNRSHLWLLQHAMWKSSNQESSKFQQKDRDEMEQWQLQDHFKKTKGGWKKGKLGRENNTRRNDCTLMHWMKNDKLCWKQWGRTVGVGLWFWRGMCFSQKDGFLQRRGTGAWADIDKCFVHNQLCGFLSVCQLTAC